MTNTTPSINEPGELAACRFCGKGPKGHWDGPYVHVSGPPDAIQFYSIVCNGCCSTASYESREAAIAKWNTRRAAVATPVDAEQSILLVAAERVAHTARQFCEEVQEDAEGVPPLQLANLNEALDAWEAYPDARESYDDSRPVLAALASLIEDQHATDHQRRVARLALTALQNNYHANELTGAERNDLGRAIAESDIAGCALENADIDALVDLFEAWLERRAATSVAVGEQAGYVRRKCSVCGERLSFTESNPCDACDDRATTQSSEVAREQKTD